MVLTLAGFGVFVLAQKEEAVPPAFEKATGAADHSAAPEAAADSAAIDPFDPDGNSPHMIRVQVEYIEVSHEALTKLLFLSDPKSADATPLRKQLQDMVLKNDAKLLETQMVICKPGQKATSQSIHEFLYATEYEPPIMPDEKAKAENAPNTGIGEGSPATPSAWETRNLGSTLEIEPTIAEDNRVIDLRLVPELVWHTGNTVWHEGKDTAGNPFKVQMPDIYTLRVNTSITCIKGQYTLVCAQSPKDAKGDTDPTRKVMVFVKCDILTVK